MVVPIVRFLDPRVPDWVPVIHETYVVLKFHWGPSPLLVWQGVGRRRGRPEAERSR